MELLSPKLTSLLSDSGSLEALPDSMNEAVIVLVSKPDKDPQDCAAYRPISLFNVDAKIFAKVLANCLSQVIKDLVDIDKTGFIPGKRTDIRRLYLNLLVTHDNQGSRVIASLDAEKAFDSIVIVQFRTNNCLSVPFNLFRGTRQGCPLAILSVSIATTSQTCHK